MQGDDMIVITKQFLFLQLFVKGLSRKYTTQDLCELLMPYGTVHAATIEGDTALVVSEGIVLFIM